MNVALEQFLMFIVLIELNVSIDHNLIESLLIVRKVKLFVLN